MRFQWHPKCWTFSGDSGYGRRRCHCHCWLCNCKNITTLLWTKWISFVPLWFFCRTNIVRRERKFLRMVKCERVQHCDTEKAAIYGLHTDGFPFSLTTFVLTESKVQVLPWLASILTVTRRPAFNILSTKQSFRSPMLTYEPFVSLAGLAVTIPSLKSKSTC